MGVVLNNAIWKAVEQYGVIGSRFILQLFLARLLAPEDFGAIAICSIFISLVDVFIQNGIAVALVQQKHVDEKKYNSVYYFSLLLATVIYVLIFVFSGMLADFFNIPILENLLRIILICIFPNSYSSILYSILRRNLQFKKVFISTITSTIIAGTIAIILAINEFGVWTLVIEVLINSVLTAITLGVIVKWYPKLQFSLKSLREVLDFGWKVFLTNIVDELFFEIRTILIGKFYSPATLSFYSRGKQFPNLVIRSINGSLMAVLLPVFSRNNENKPLLRNLTRQSIVLSSTLIFPILTLLAISAPTIIEVLLTDKWLPCVPFLQLMCIYYSSWIITTTNIQLLYGFGNSKKVLQLQTIRKIVDLIIIVFTIRISIDALVWGEVIISIIYIPVYLHYSGKNIDYKVLSQIKDIAPVLIFCTIEAITVKFLCLIELPLIISLLFQILGAVTVYLLLMYIFKYEGLCLLVNKMKKV
ncbi:lipopolysaccharide biosynthesis protein [Bacteroides oleiciplenus]|uniref:Polysaccharide biosynthesis protein C-terminal domain-containing protein n=1 Tax=Bacteroides oleiciplenus YIT 12058 TaxID=742727 RepID=K9ERW3_9BACE|nr:lipopolysaccharide biosynthesis protein [Bacteroides oleiciplenus]EKU91890.1 hypothetical protein HMPREF9447_00876 [Bacteroides oleiciplenus YIT 12058]